LLLLGQAARFAGREARPGRGWEQLGVVPGPKERVFQRDTGAELAHGRWTDVG